MAFEATWGCLLDHIGSLSATAWFTLPFSEQSFVVKTGDANGIVIADSDGDETTTLDREKFATLYQRISESNSAFDLDKLPSGAIPYAIVLTIHPHYDIDETDWQLYKSETPTPPSFVSKDSDSSPDTEAKTTLDPTIEDMLEAMGDPKGRVTCPIDGCQYSHRSPASVARHVSGSSTDKHLWEHTAYSGWRDFVRTHEEPP